MPGEQRDISDGTLKVRRAREGDREIVSLHGELELANAATAEAALKAALDEASGKVVVDMRELEFIDSTGIALLVAALEADGDAGRLSFVASESPAVVRVLELTGLAERLPPAE